MRKLFARLALNLAAIVSFAGLAQAEIIDVDNAQLAELARKGTPVVDIRTAGEWRESGIVPGSHLITLFDEQGRADPEWLNKIKAVAKPDQPVAVICRSGNRTKAASRMLSEQGYAKVYNVKNGIRAWAGEGRPLAAASTAAECKAGKTC